LICDSLCYNFLTWIDTAILLEGGSNMEPDWLELWRELVKSTYNPGSERLWQRYEKHARKRSERPDPLLEFVKDNLAPGDTVIDIGAGSGRWTIPLAAKAGGVSAIEPSPEMSILLRQNIDASGRDNIETIAAKWEEASVQTHDIVVCAHAMYSSPDLADFVRKMERLARKRCYLAMRLLQADSILGELSLAIYGRRHDSANAIVAYNALFSMGIYANVIIEEGIYRWENASLEEAFLRAKRHLRLETEMRFDSLIRDTLQRRLVYQTNTYIWPDGMRSALLWWSPVN
jgi:2-polyprenyl-3-methyl-5-hydroxy-6-metoxy-1,4-benzoquinol methylase